MSTELEAAALEYAGRGWPVVPLYSIDTDGECTCGNGCGNPGKHPHTEHGLKHATTDKGEISRWWARWPEANIGLLTGETSGIVVLDIDGEEGKETLQELGHTLPATITAETGRGWHFIFRHPGGRVKSSSGEIGLKVDVKGDASYIVAPPSVHVSGKRYQWVVGPEESEPAPAPAWLTATKGTELAPAVEGPILAGNRNQVLTSLAGSMRHRGMGEAAVAAGLLEENKRCQPRLSEDEVRGIAASISRYEPADSGSEGKVSQASLLVELANKRYSFAVADTGEPFAVPIDGPNVVQLLRGRGSLRSELAQAFAARHGKVPSTNSLTDALNVLEGKALQGGRRELHLRVARHGDGQIVLDLGREDGASAIISPDGWRVEPSPVLFRRTALSGELPLPAEEGDLGELQALLNISDADWPLLLAWLVSVLSPDIPHAIAAFVGQQGSAKSWAARLAVSALDPSPAPIRTTPRDVEGWAVTASGSWIVALDNVSKVPEWLSDALCRAVTGDGLVRRKLYSDSELSVLSFRRVVALTAIDPGVLRGDLADRLVRFELEPIPDSRRREDADVQADFARAHPRILAGLLDLAVEVLRALPEVKLRGYPRMADFAKVVAAVDVVMGTRGLDLYLEKRSRLAEDVVEDDVVARTIREVLGTEGEIRGDAPTILEALRTKLPDPERPPKEWPESSRQLQAALMRATPVLGQVGIEVARLGPDARTRRQTYLITSKQYAEEPSEPSEPSQTAVESLERPEGSCEGSSDGLEEPSQEPSQDNPAHRAESEGSEGSEGLFAYPLDADSDGDEGTIEELDL